MNNIAMRKNINIVRLDKDHSDVSYWREKSPEERIMFLESLRSQYNEWKYSDAEQRFQRVYRIVKQK